MRSYCRVVLALGLIALLAGPALAQQQQRQRGQGRGQGGGFGQGGIGALLNNESVQKELKMDAGQVDKVKEAVKQVTDKHRDDFAKLRDLSQEERRTKTQELTRTVSAETRKAVSDILKPEQIKRLQQIELQQAGVMAFNQPEVQKALNLTDEQKQKIKTIGEDFVKEQRELRQPGGNPQETQQKMAALRKQTTDKVQSLLTEDQKKSWKELTGEPFAMQAGARRRQQDR
jgi:hypothetical protein